MAPLVNPFHAATPAVTCRQIEGPRSGRSTREGIGTYCCRGCGACVIERSQDIVTCKGSGADIAYIGSEVDAPQCRAILEATGTNGRNCGSQGHLLKLRTFEQAIGQGGDAGRQ